MIDSYAFSRMFKRWRFAVRYTVQWYWEDELVEGFLKPMSLWLPLGTVRQKAQEIADDRKFPAHSFTVKSADGALSERWFRLNGQWRRKDARTRDP